MRILGEVSRTSNETIAGGQFLSVKIGGRMVVGDGSTPRG